MVYAEFLVPVVARSLQLLALDAVDHYGILGHDQRVYLPDSTNTSVISDSVSLLDRVSRNRANLAFPLVERSWLLRMVRGRSITRLVVELASGELLVVAVDQWLTEAAARKLADGIEAFLWEQQSGMPRRKGGYGHPYGMPIGMPIPATPFAVWPTKF